MSLDLAFFFSLPIILSLSCFLEARVHRGPPELIFSPPIVPNMNIHNGVTTTAEPLFVLVKYSCDPPLLAAPKGNAGH